MPRSLASLTIAFGLVAIPVRLYPVTRRTSALRFKWMTAEGGAVRQRLVAEPVVRPEPANPTPARAPWGSQAASDEGGAAAEPQPEPEDGVVRGWRMRMLGGPQHDEVSEAAATSEAAGERHGEGAQHAGLQKGLEIEPGRFVLFTPAELDALATTRRDSIDLVSFVPPQAVDPLYVEKSHFLAPAPRAERPFSLLMHAMQATNRCALATWAWRGREHPALMRPGNNGVLVLHQLQFGDAVRDPAELEVKLPAATGLELKLAVQLIEQSSSDRFEPLDFIDPAKQRILDAARRKLAGGAVVDKRIEPAAMESAEVIDLVAALRASLATPAPQARRPPRRATSSAGPRKRAGSG